MAGRCGRRPVLGTGTGTRTGTRTIAKRLPLPGTEFPPPREADGGISQFRRRRGLGARPSWRTPNENLAQQHALLQSTLTWQTPPAKRRSSGTSGPAGSAVTRTRRGKLAFPLQSACRRRSRHVRAWPRVRPTLAQLAEAARFRKVRRESDARTPEVPLRTGQTPAGRLHFLHCADGRIGTQPWHQELAQAVTKLMCSSAWRRHIWLHSSTVIGPRNGWEERFGSVFNRSVD